MQVLPPHVGLGSGTQLALAVGRAFARWHGLDVDTVTLAQWLHRGLRSGIGIAGFDQGGLLVDGGPGADGSPAPLLARLPFPDAWRIVVVQDRTQRGLSGAAEKAAIAALPPLPRSAAAEICHNVLMRVLPGVASTDFAPFAAGITRLQQLLGEHYAPVQGGLAYASAPVARLMEWIADACAGVSPALDAEGRKLPGAAVGQSSWGPTGFAILPSQTLAEAVIAAAHAAHVVSPQLSLRVVRGLNRGAVVTDLAPLQRAG
jgi:beta-RFAP synthase